MSDGPTYCCMVCNERLSRPENYCDYCAKVVRHQKRTGDGIAGDGAPVSRDRATEFQCDDCGKKLSWHRAIHEGRRLCRACQASRDNPDSTDYEGNPGAPGTRGTWDESWDLGLDYGGDE